MAGSEIMRCTRDRSPSKIPKEKVLWCGVWCGVVEAGVQPPPICVTRRIRIVSKVSNKPHSKPGPTITSKPSPNKHNRFLEPAPPSKPGPSTTRPTRAGSPKPPHTFFEPNVQVRCDGTLETFHLARQLKSTSAMQAQEHAP